MSLDEHTTQELDSGGNFWERLDMSRRDIVQLCGEKGKTLFLFLLNSSMIRELASQGTIAIFSQRCLRDVALQLGWSPDTVKRYVAVFRAVNLVYHYHDHRREVELRIPLGAYIPLTNFAALDDLIRETRKKQRQLATNVKTRYIVRFGDPTQTHSGETQAKFQELKAILDDEHLEPLKRQRLQIKLANLLIHFIKKTEGDLNDIQDNSDAILQRERQGITSEQGDSNNLQEDLVGQTSISSPVNSQLQGDSKYLQEDPEQMTSSSHAYQAEKKGDLEQSQGDPTRTSADLNASLCPTQTEVQGDLNHHQGDPILPSHAQKSLKNDLLGDSNELVVMCVDVKAPYTYNVNYLINNITNDNVIRKRIAQFLAHVLEEKEFDNGYPTFSKYLKAFKIYSPDVIGRAFLATMFLLHRKNWQTNPGATFTNQCKILSGQKPLAHYTLDDVEEWIKSWGHLAYPELIVVITAPAPEQRVPEPASLITEPRKTAQKNSEYPERLSSRKKQRTFGLQYTGRPVTVNKGIHNLGEPARPSGES